jgi:zinc transport system substrate-binding protein
MKFSIFSRSCVLALMLCGFSAPPLEAAGVRVFASIAPQRWFIEKIGAGRVAVSVMVPAGADAHTFEPKPKQMAELSQAALYFAVGIDFERAWLKKFSAASPRMRVVHTEEGIERIPMRAHAAAHAKPAGSGGGGKGAHGHGHDHAGGPDPHIWLSPPLVKLQAGRIRDALIQADPQGRPVYEEGHRALLEEIDLLDAELKALFADRRGARFMVLHPSWGYFAQAYGLEQVSVEIEGKDPKPAQLQELIREARAEGIRAVFVQPQFSAKSAELIARAIGARVVTADPLAEDWAANLRDVAARFSEALK